MNKRIKYGLIGAVIGICVGFIVFIIGLNLTFDEWYFASIGFPFGVGENMGTYLGFKDWARMIPYFLGGIITYTIIGITVLMLIGYYKEKK